MRIELVCHLMDLCVPTELRFMSTIIEGLNRKNPCEQDNIKHIANHLKFPSNSTPQELETVFQYLKEAPVPPCHPKFPFHIILPNPSNPAQAQAQHNNIGNIFYSLSAFF